jgi:hypothetical protein
VGNVELIESITASSQSTVDFTTGINNDYWTYLFTLSGVRVDTGGVFMYMRYSNDGGSTYVSGSNYDNLIESLFGGGENYSEVNNVGQIYVSDDGGGGISALSSDYYSARIILSKPWDANLETMCYGQFYYHDPNNIHSRGYFGAKKDGGTSTDAIRFTPSSGNITSGQFNLYGLG